jgi:hypothetical protein
MLNLTSNILVLALIVTLPYGCQDSPECHANVDCGAASACVDNVCIEDKGNCETAGGFLTVAELEPQNADEIEKMHVVLDDDHALHYCYHGKKDNGQVSFYGRQVDFETVEEEPISLDGKVIECGGIGVSKRGTVFLFSKNTTGALYKKNDAWEHVDLAGLTSLEARGAVYSQHTVASFSADRSGGVFLSLSIGYAVDYQPLYIAKINENGVLEVIVNSWSETGEPTVTGYAPVLVPRENNEITIVYYDKAFSEVVFTDSDFTRKIFFHGDYPGTAARSLDEIHVVALDQNHNMQLYEYNRDGLTNIGVLGKMDFYRGQLPWKIFVDSVGQTHLLFEDKNEGINTLSYNYLNKSGIAGFEQVVSNNVFGGSSGTQRYDLTSDICLRPQFAVVEGDRNNVRIKVMERR